MPSKLRNDAPRVRAGMQRNAWAPGCPSADRAASRCPAVHERLAASPPSCARSPTCDNSFAHAPCSFAELPSQSWWAVCHYSSLIRPSDRPQQQPMAPPPPPAPPRGGGPPPDGPGRPAGRRPTFEEKVRWSNAEPQAQVLGLVELP